MSQMTEDLEVLDAMKNTQATPYLFIRNAYNAMKGDCIASAEMWLRHAERFRGFYDDNPREAENFNAVLSMAFDFFSMLKNIK